MYSFKIKFIQVLTLKLWIIMVLMFIFFVDRRNLKIMSIITLGDSISDKISKILDIPVLIYF